MEKLLRWERAATSVKYLNSLHRVLAKQFQLKK
jgi:hypothetical protein